MIQTEYKNVNSSNDQQNMLIVDLPNTVTLCEYIIFCQVDMGYVVGELNSNQKNIS